MTQTIVIGIDGGTYRLIDRYRDSLPTLSAFLDDGYEGVLLSSRPSITSVAWPSFVTGQNPGRIGLFDFLYRDFETMNFSLNDVRERESSTSIGNILMMKLGLHQFRWFRIAHREDSLYRGVSLE